MSSISGDKNYIEKLLSALSVDDAINSFTLIDEKIIDLLKCSTDDFLTLNDHFKNYHKESKNISQNASNIIQNITDPAINKSFTTLKNIAESFSSLSISFTNRVELLDVELKKAVNKIENIKISHQNYKQDIASIRLLLANITPQETYESSKKTISAIEDKLANIKEYLTIADSHASHFITKATESYLFLANIKKENYDHLARLNDNIGIGFTLFNKKYQEASQFFISLKEQSERNSVNIASIITNLQYHDIIRQKIEHIQRTHKDIISELRSFHGQDAGVSQIHNKVKTFIKIRDVSGLQAAQLIHANNQYQVAINEISKDLENIGNEMISISTMCDNLVGKSEQAKDYYLNNIVDNLNSALVYNSKLVEIVAIIKQHTGTLDKIKSDLRQTYDNINLGKDELLTLVKQVETKNNTSISDNINETLGLIKEIGALQNHLDSFYNELSDKFELIFKIDKDFQGDNNVLQSFGTISSTIPGLIELLKQSINRVDEFLYLNSTNSLNVSDSIRNSLSKIKYYEMFEKSCETIIEELNTINLRLNSGEGMTDKNREENLKLLKSRYTMASEHIIHDHLTKSGDFNTLSDASAEQILNLANQNSAEDDDNLELF